MPIRIALLNDDEVVELGLEAMLREYAAQIQVVELATGPATPIDIALCDTTFRPPGTASTLAELISNPAVRRTVVYTWNYQPWQAKEAIAQGASGYLSKSLPAEQLVDALLAIHQGQRIICPEPESLRLGEGDWDGKEAGLTAREAEVLTLITQGYSNAEIADLTGLSINSIKSYIRSCYRKMGVTSRSKAVLWGIERGMGPQGWRRPVEAR